MKLIDLVADVGESYGSFRHGEDPTLIPLLSSANVACGFHAGDPRVMAQTVRRCTQEGVSIGAHPGFPDLVGFGRRAIDCSATEIFTDTLYQIGALAAFARANGSRLAHVSPHGRLGNLVQTRPDYAEAVARAIFDFDPTLIVLTPPGELTKAAEALGLTSGSIGFVDRSYEADGTLTPRDRPGAVLTDPVVIAKRAVALVTRGVVSTSDGNEIDLAVDSVLLHGDNPGVTTIAAHVRRTLEAEGVRVAPLPEVLRARRAHG